MATIMSTLFLNTTFRSNLIEVRGAILLRKTPLKSKVTIKVTKLKIVSQIEQTERLLDNLV